jgi:DNA-binding NtrC family response regulator
MFEDALFGHARGAFTGALGDTPGLLREADGGTAFFDEISGLPLSLQAKLLRAIETGEFRPVGARHDARSDFRLVAATNERLDALVADRRFRADLAHRIAAIVVHVPPLADRADDIPLLVETFLARANRAPLPVTAGAIELLRSQPWPGNVRELKQVVEWSAALASSCIDDEVVATALVHRSSAPTHDERVLERKRLRDALVEARWDTRRAAHELGIHRATLYRRMKRLQLVVPSLRGAP